MRKSWRISKEIFQIKSEGVKRGGVGLYMHMWGSAMKSMVLPSTDPSIHVELLACRWISTCPDRQFHVSEALHSQWHGQDRLQAQPGSAWVTAHDNNEEEIGLMSHFVWHCHAANSRHTGMCHVTQQDAGTEGILSSVGRWARPAKLPAEQGPSPVGALPWASCSQDRNGSRHKSSALLKNIKMWEPLMHIFTAITMSFMTRIQVKAALLLIPLQAEHPMLWELLTWAHGYEPVWQRGPWDMQIHIQLFISTSMSKFQIKTSTHNKPPNSN